MLAADTAKYGLANPRIHHHAPPIKIHEMLCLT